MQSLDVTGSLLPCFPLFAVPVLAPFLRAAINSLIKDVALYELQENVHVYILPAWFETYDDFVNITIYSHIASTSTMESECLRKTPQAKCT